MENDDKQKEVIHEKVNCYEMGKKFGRCGTQVLFELPFNNDDDIIIPEECRGTPETNRGIMDGVKEVYDFLRNLNNEMGSATKKE